MHTYEVLTLVCLIAGPILAVQAQKTIEGWQAKKQRKERIFRTLMVNRNAALSDDMAAALNAVPLDFTKGNARDEDVLEKWRSYLAHLRKPSAGEGWGPEEQRRQLDLLEAMAKHIGTKFPRSELEAGAYVPDYHWSRWNEHEDIRKGVLALLKGKPLIVENSGVSTPEGKKAAQMVTEILEGKRALRVAGGEARNEIDLRAPGRPLNRE